MDIERLIALIVKTVIEELTRQGAIRPDGVALPPPSCDPATPAAVPKPDPARSTRHVISAEIVLDTARAGKTVLEAPPNALITPLAQDTAKEKGITIRRDRET